MTAPSIDPAIVEAWARKLAEEHYADRFQKPIDDPHVQMNVDANWHRFASDVRLTMEFYATAGEEMGGRPAKETTALNPTVFRTPRL